MSTGYFLIEAGTYVVINNVFIDKAGVEQTLNVNFVDEAGADQLIFYSTGIPMWPVTVAGHPRAFGATASRHFEATANRIFE